MPNYIYYIYIYIDPRDFIPFYIGKGMKDRMYVHLKETYQSTENRKKWCKIQSIKNDGLEPLIMIFRNNLKEREAYELEKALILSFGRIGKEENGCLTNICEDSRPPSQKGVPKTKEHRRKISEAHKGKKHVGYKKRSLEARQQASDRALGENNNMFGKSFSKESLEKMSNAHSKLWEITYPDGHKEIIKNLSKFCEEHGLFLSNLLQLPSVRGFSVKRMFEKKEMHKNVEIIQPDGKTFITNNLSETCKKFGLHPGVMCNIASGNKDIKHRGFSARYI